MIETLGTRFTNCLH